MPVRALHRLYGPLVYAYSLSRLNSRGRLPMPHDPPIAHASGPAPDRILVLGGLAVRGLGVASHELGFAGRLARALAARTGRGADVEARGFARFDARSAADALRAADLDRFDAVVLQIGAYELLSLRPVDIWREDVDEVMRAVAESVPAATPVLVLSTPPLPSTTDASTFMDRRYASFMQRMNAATVAAVARSRVGTFLQLSADGTQGPFGRDTTTVYAQWAEDVAPVLSAAVAVAAPHAGAVAVDESERQRALDDLHLTRDPDIRIERIVRMARVAFGVTAAALTIIDHDIQWKKSVVGDLSTDDAPRREAVCDATIRTPGVLVIEDLADDPVFGRQSWVSDAGGKRFYAGYPLEAPGGQRIGALCLIDRSPRTFSAVEVTLLRDLALRAQKVLWEVA